MFLDLVVVSHVEMTCSIKTQRLCGESSVVPVPAGLLTGATPWCTGQAGQMHSSLVELFVLRGGWSALIRRTVSCLAFIACFVTRRL